MKEVDLSISLPVTQISQRFYKYVEEEEFITKSQIIKKLKEEASNKITHQEEPQKLKQYNFDLLMDKMPGRTLQLKKICEFLSNLRIGDKDPLCLHGNTGCGKTSLILRILKFIENEYPQFDIAYLNCMSVWSAKHLYSFMLSRFFNQKHRKPQVQLTKYFTHLTLQEGQGRIKLLVLDEVDLYFKQTKVIYNILEWAQRSKIRFGVIMISNMIDFSIKLEGKAKSRLKFNSLIFQPYKYDNLKEILDYKYPQCEMFFESDALMYICKKVASVNSDVRLLQKYYESLVKEYNIDQKNKITIEQVIQKLSPISKQLRTFLQPYKFLIKILMNIPNKSCISRHVYQDSLFNFNKALSTLQVLQFLKQLSDFGLIQINKDRQNSNIYFLEWGIVLKDDFYLVSEDEIIMRE